MLQIHTQSWVSCFTMPYLINSGLIFADVPNGIFYKYTPMNVWAKL